MNITNELYNELIKYAKTIEHFYRTDKSAEDIIHDLIISKGSEITAANFKYYISISFKSSQGRIKATKIDYINYKHTEILKDIQCKKCLNVLPESEFYNYITKDGRYKNSNTCKKCYYKRKKELKIQKVFVKKKHEPIDKNSDSYVLKIKLKQFLYRKKIKETGNIHYYLNLFQKKEYNRKMRESKEFRDKEYERLKKKRQNIEFKTKENKERLQRYYEIEKKTPIKLKKRQESVNKYKKNHRDVINAQNKRYAIKKYGSIAEFGKVCRKKRKEKGIIDATAKDRAKRFLKKQTSQLGDWYIKRLLLRYKKYTKEQITPELIKEKRNQILEKRGAKKITYA